MNLYERDFSILTIEEEAEWRTLQKKEVTDEIDGFCIKEHNLYEQYPKAARHFDSLFPNHYLDIVELRDRVRLTALLTEFSTLLNFDEVTERKITDFIKSKEAYFLIASVLRAYYVRFGHHAAYLFPEFKTGNSHAVDYLLVGLGSGGWEFVFVELEAPNGKITLQNGDLGSAFRKGLSQIEDWDTWLERYYSSFQETFRKYLKKGESLPDEFMRMDKSRLHFAVVAGRRTDFKEKTYRIRRQKFEKDRVLVLHYDNLVDSAGYVMTQATY